LTLARPTVVESLIAPHALRQLFCIEAGPIPLDDRRVGRRRTDGRDDGVVCRRPATRASSGVASSHGLGRTSWREVLVHSRVEWTGFKLLVIPFLASLTSFLLLQDPLKASIIELTDSVGYKPGQL
jgi:hypothetical protein